MMEVRPFIRFRVQFDVMVNAVDMLIPQENTVCFFLCYVYPADTISGQFYECEECNSRGRSCGSRSFERHIRTIPPDILLELESHVDLRHGRGKEIFQ